MTIMDDDYDYCYECGGYGDDYSFDDDGELHWNCPDCTMNPDRYDDEGRVKDENSDMDNSNL